MSSDAWITIAVLAGVLFALVRGLAMPSIAVLAGDIVLLAAGVLTTEQAFAGFSNPAPITVAALYVLAGAVGKTGALQPVVHAMLGRTRDGRRILGRMLVPVAGSSAIFSNTPVVAMLAPQVAAWAERFGISPSRVLMPLSFASILGGMVTLIGTSTNVVVSGLLEAAGHEPLGMFAFTPAGLPIAVAGLAVVVLLAPSAVPVRRPAHRTAEDESREFVVAMRVDPAGPLDGRSVEAAGLRGLSGLFLVEIERGRDVIAPVGPETTLHGGDRLTFVGRAEDVVELQHRRGLAPARGRGFDVEGPGPAFFEAVIGGASPLVGRTLREAAFRGRYQAAVVAIHRAGERVTGKLGDEPLAVGDTLLLLADREFRRRWRGRSDFLLIARLGGSPPLTTPKALWVGAVVLGVVAVAATGAAPIVHAALVGVLALFGLGIMTGREARAAVDLDVVVLIAAAFGLAAAVETTGLADGVAGLAIGGLGPLGSPGAALGLIVAALVLTELVTNNAAAVLVFPIAMSVAEATPLEPRPLAVAVAIAASASFLTPIGYQTNTMVYGPGGYRFGDYARLGAPLTALVVLGLVAYVSL